MPPPSHSDNRSGKSKHLRGFASRRSRRILCWENSFILCIVERACSPFPGAKFLGLHAALWSEQASGFANQDGSILRLWNQFSYADQTSLPLYELVPERAVHNEWH